MIQGVLKFILRDGYLSRPMIEESAGIVHGMVSGEPQPASGASVWRVRRAGCGIPDARAISAFASQDQLIQTLEDFATYRGVCPVCQY